MIGRREVLVHVRRGDEFLVLRRCKRLGGYWHPVAGGIESGEDAAAAARRELHEEIALEAGPLAELSVFEYVREGWEPRRGATCVVQAFAVEVPAGFEPELNWEHDEYRWCSPEEALELLHWPEPRQILRSLA